jgi:integrase
MRFCAGELRDKKETKLPTAHLTDVVVSRLKTVGVYYDDATPSFGVRVGKHRKAWIITRGVDRQRITIGQYPGMPLAEARKEAKRRLAQPAAETSRLKFSDAYERYKERLATKKPRTQQDYRRVLERILMPELGNCRLADIKYEEIIEIARKLSRCENGHCLAVARTFFRWCVRPPRRYIPHSPLEGVEIPQGRRRKRVLKPGELPRVWLAAAQHSYPYGTIVQLLILNGQRRGETASLRWPWINERERTITLPDWITKNGKEHTFPYGEMTAEVLATIPRLNSTDLLFPSRVSGDRPISGWSKYKKELRDGVEGWTLHDLRRTFRTLHAQIGSPAHIAERLINHAAAVRTEVEEIYDVWTYMPEMRTAVERYEAQLSALLHS